MAPRPRPSGAERRWASVEAGRRSSAPARRTPRRRSPFVVRSALAALCWSCEAGTAKAAEQRFLLDIPRITTAELERNQSLRSGLHAYIVTDWVGSRWSASSWTLEYLRQKIPFEWVDYYPNNMEDPGSKPYLYRFEEALPQFLQKSKIPKYMQLRLGLRGWNRLKKDINPKPVPEVFWDDDSWIGQCMKKPSGKVDREAVDNFFVTQQWKFLLIGEKGTSMFFHKDGTAASSWQAQIVGKKRWTLCPNSQSHLLDVNINTFKPDYTRFPKFAKALCGQVTMSPGDLLYYPAYWWHHPYNLETPTISYTGALVGVEADRMDLGGEQKPHARFYQDLLGKCAKCWKKADPKRLCDDISEKWPGAAPPMMRSLCEDYLPECFKKWDAHARALHGVARQEL